MYTHAQRLLLSDIINDQFIVYTKNIQLFISTNGLENSYKLIDSNSFTTCCPIREFIIVF